MSPSPSLWGCGVVHHLHSPPHILAEWMTTIKSRVLSQRPSPCTRTISTPTTTLERSSHRKRGRRRHGRKSYLVKPPSSCSVAMTTPGPADADHHVPCWLLPPARLGGELQRRSRCHRCSRNRCSTSTDSAATRTLTAFARSSRCSAAKVS